VLRSDGASGGGRKKQKIARLRQHRRRLIASQSIVRDGKRGRQPFPWERQARRGGLSTYAMPRLYRKGTAPRSE
jgi:hypothetical protein